MGREKRAAEKTTFENYMFGRASCCESNQLVMMLCQTCLLFGCLHCQPWRRCQLVCSCEPSYLFWPAFVLLFPLASLYPCVPANATDQNCVSNFAQEGIYDACVTCITIPCQSWCECYNQCYALLRRPYFMRCFSNCLCLFRSSRSSSVP